MMELLLGQIPEAIYFALFLLFTKQLKEKRILFIVIMIVEYVLLIRAMPYNLYSHIGYFITTYLTLKILYKEKSQIIDVFTLAIASLVLITIDIILYFTIGTLTGNYILFVVLDRIVLFTLLIVFRNKLNNIQKVYKKLWNRNDNVKKKMKSTTFRCLNLVLFNISFYIINLTLLYCIFKNIVK